MVFTYSGGILPTSDKTPAQCEVQCLKQQLDEQASESNPLAVGITMGNICMCGFFPSNTLPRGDDKHKWILGGN